MSKIMRNVSGVLILVLFSSLAFAQDKPIDRIDHLGGGFSGLPADLLPPGARSLGLGGAFGAVADDATAAVANPAGLANLSTTEVSLHIRNTDSDVNFFDTDAFDSGLYSSVGDLNKTYSDSGTDVSFASLVKPFDSWVISAYYLNQLDFKSEQQVEDVVFDDFWVDTYTNVNSVDSGIEAYGASVAFRVSSNFSIGATVQYTQLDLVSTDQFVLDHWYQYETIWGSDSLVTASQIIDRFTAGSSIGQDPGSDSSDSDTTFNAGLLWSISPKFSLGLVYRQGAEFDMKVNSYSGWETGCLPGATIPDCDFLASENDLFGFSDSELVPVKVSVPDTITIGLAWRPTNTFLVSLDVNKIGYSDSTPVRDTSQGFLFNVNEDPVNESFNRADFNDPVISGRSGPFTEKIDDEYTVHLGVEKVFRRPGEFMSSITIRGGAFTVEDHDGAVDIDSDDTVLTAGLGVVMGGDDRGHKQFQLDLGAAFGDDSTNIILSGIFRF